MPQSKHDRLAHAAAHLNIKMSDIVRDSLDNWLDAYDKATA